MKMDVRATDGIEMKGTNSMNLSSPNLSFIVRKFFNQMWYPFGHVDILWKVKIKNSCLKKEMFFFLKRG